MGVNVSRWLLWSLNGLWFPKLVGKAWTDIVTRYVALGLTTLTTLTIHKYPNWDPRVSQKGYYGVLTIAGDHFGISWFQIWEFMYF